LKGNELKKYIHFLLILFSSTIFAQPNYVATIHPIQEILKNVVGDRGAVEAVMPPGASPHTYEMKPSDINRVNSATALFSGDEHLDHWAHEFDNPNSIEMFGMVPADFQLEIKSWFGRNKNKSLGEDPHFWTDPLTVKALLPNLVQKLSKLDPQGKEQYKANAEIFAKNLDALSAQTAKTLKPIQGKSVLLSHPFFQYYLNRYQIELKGIIETNPGTEPTPRDIAEMIKAVKKEKINLILAHPQHSTRPSELVEESTNCKIVKLDPLGGVPGRMTYEEMIYYNTKIIYKALSN
jgi:zinc transport system substrate-binding protein